MKKIKYLLVAIRPYQWIKNMAIFAAIIFTGQLFNPPLLEKTIIGFFSLCLLSSASYLFNDIIDAPYDRLHPVKKKRPIAAKKLSVNTAFQAAIFLLFLGLSTAYFLGFSFFLLSLIFAGLHFSYTLFLKKHALWDILSIASSFVLRTYAGEVLTGYHIPVWLMFSVIFLSLFIASGKRRSELVKEGKKTRKALHHYHEKLLDFYLALFADATLLSYSLFTFTTPPPSFRPRIFNFLLTIYPKGIDRKWMMISIPFVILGVMRYAQLIFLSEKGEQPAKALASDSLLLFSILGWGITIVSVLYVL